jgi:PTS system beta-glucosides-specific IIC component
MMAKNDYSLLAEEIVKKVGGKENIVSVINCMTRLRFVLKNEAIPVDDEIKKIKGVQGVMNKGGQYQVIIGTHVNEVINYVKKEAGLNDEQETIKEDMKIVKEGSLFNRFFKIITGCMTPFIGVMVASGILKGILTILVTVGALKTTDGTYLILYGAADSVLYFLPIILGFSAGKVFGCNQYVTAAIGAALLYPNIAALQQTGEAITFLKIPVTLVSYSNSLLPILLGAWFASHVERLSKKIIPKMLQLMFVPLFTVAITVPVIYLLIGPIMTSLSGILSNGVVSIFGLFPPLAGVVLGAFWQLIVLLGLHAAFIPVLMNNLITMGSDPVNAILGLTVWALAGTSLGYALKVKNKDNKGMGFSNTLSCLCGVTEPTIYSIALPKFKLFVCAFIGGGISGGILASLGGKLYAFAGDGLFRIPGMINPAGLDISFYGFIVTALISFGVSGALAFFVTNAQND